MSRIILVAEADKAAADDPDETFTLLSPLPGEEAFGRNVTSTAIPNS